MDDDLELEGLLLEEEKQNVFIDSEPVDIDNNTITERWASWVNTVNR